MLTLSLKCQRNTRRAMLICGDARVHSSNKKNQVSATSPYTILYICGCSCQVIKQLRCNLMQRRREKESSRQRNCNQPALLLVLQSAVKFDYVSVSGYGARYSLDRDRAIVWLYAIVLRASSALLASSTDTQFAPSRGCVLLMWFQMMLVGGIKLFVFADVIYEGLFKSEQLLWLLVYGWQRDLSHHLVR